MSQSPGLENKNNEKYGGHRWSDTHPKVIYEQFILIQL